MDIEGHNELHACIAPPLKLTAIQMQSALCLLEEMDGEPLQPHERLLELADYFATRQLREQRVGANLRLQAGFVQEYGV
jgi:hypothetical protein